MKNGLRAVGFFDRNFIEKVGIYIEKTDIVMNKFELISIQEAVSLAQQEGYIVVDLRSREEYDKNHIENAINIENVTMEKIDAFHRKDLIWVLYCRRGSLSFRIASEMSDDGYKVMAVVGGFQP
jgi:rhodanese-related sulfurtransferase